ncbi:MAG: hypothetical protein B7Y99_06805 [Caulobacterales bacterium 32-69-10]|nr:MAG: hypothetical protein B7Y99_06805 [Caulobacterales bacterium 32-69-10]
MPLIGSEESLPMSISPVQTAPYDSLRERALAATAGLSRQSGPLASPREIRPISMSGLSVFDAVQARALGKMDVDGDGGLTAAELSAGVPGGKAPGAVDPAYFAAMDKDADGKLQLGELQAASMFGMNTLDALLAAQEGSASTEPPARFEASNIGAWLVREGDGDGDGVLSAEEFAAIGPAGDYAAPREGVEFPGSDILSKAGRAFAEADADKDGKLTGEELAHVMETGPHRIYFGDASNLAPTLMGVADANGDAAISMDEARATAPGVDGLDEAFVQGDADGDGKLSAAEVKAMIDAKPTLYSSGLIKIGEESAAGDIALRRLLLASLDRVSEAFRSRFERPGTETTA